MPKGDLKDGSAPRRPAKGDQRENNGGGPDHPCEAGEGQYFRVKFCNARSVKRAGEDPWAVIPVVAAHNLRDGNEHHRQNRHPHDPELRHLNEVIAGPSTAAELVALAHDTLSSIAKPPKRWDTVMCWEFLVKPPAGWDRKAYWNEVLKFIASDPATTGMPVVSFVIHRDQSLAHAHVLVLPIRDGTMVSRGKVNPMGVWQRFHDHMRRLLDIRTDTPSQRRERRARTLGDLAATPGKGPKTRPAAEARDAALAGRIDPASGELRVQRFPAFAAAGFDLSAGWEASSGIHFGGIHIHDAIDGCAGGGIHIGGIHVGSTWGAPGAPMWMPPKTTWGSLSPSAQMGPVCSGFARKSAPALALTREGMPARERCDSGHVLALPGAILPGARGSVMDAALHPAAAPTEPAAPAAPAGLWPDVGDADGDADVIAAREQVDAFMAEIERRGPPGHGSKPRVFRGCIVRSLAQQAQVDRKRAPLRTGPASGVWELYLVALDLATLAKGSVLTPGEASKIRGPFDRAAKDIAAGRCGCVDWRDLKLHAARSIMGALDHGRAALPAGAMDDTPWRAGPAA